MPDYVLIADLEGLVPAAFIVQALDDNEDGQSDAAAWAAVLKSVHQAIDGTLGMRFPVPFAAPLPAKVSEAAAIFACELLYARRGRSGEHNPWTARADAMRKTLERIAEGKLPLTPQTQRATPPVSIVAEQAKTTSCAGWNMA